MRAPREIRKWVNNLRRLFSKKNGVVPSWAFDNPWMEAKWSKSERQRSRKGHPTHD